MHKRNITKHSHSVTLTLVMGGKVEKPVVLSDFGPVRAGLTITQSHSTEMVSQDQVLTELLNTLERKLAILESKSLELLDTWSHDIQPRAERLLSTTDITGISGLKDN